MAIVSSAITSAVVMFAVTIIPAFLIRKTKLLRANIKECGEKYIDISDLFFWFIYGVETSFSVLGLLVYLYSDEPMAGIAFVVMGLIFVLLGAILHVLDTSVTWTSEYISGAKSGLSLKKNTIQWNDVTSVKCLPNKTFQVEDMSGKSVHWSVYQNGWYEVIEDLRRIRPDVDTGDFD